MLQRTDEWFQARLGKVTGSGLSKIMGGAGTREQYLYQLLTERITGVPTTIPPTMAMEHGIQTEDEAVEYLQLIENFTNIEEVGFIEHPFIAGFGASPDRIIDNQMVLEVKCPNTSTHLTYMATHKIPKQYQYQMYAEMMCTGLNKTLFYSYDNRVSPELKIYTQIFEAEPTKIEEIEKKVVEFLDELNYLEKKVLEYGEFRINGQG